MTIPERVAGHRWDMRDRCSLLHHNGTVCPVRWLDIHDADESCIGKEGWAHIGNLNAEELKQIRTERERRGVVYDQAINGRQSESEAQPTAEYYLGWGTQTRAEIDPTDTEEF